VPCADQRRVLRIQVDIAEAFHTLDMRLHALAGAVDRPILASGDVPDDLAG